MRSSLIIAAMLFLSGLHAYGQAPWLSVPQIDRHYREISGKADAASSDPEQGMYGELIVNELKVNTLQHPWRAVGVYELTFRFYYRGGDKDEKRLYPDELVLVRAERKISSRTYTEEYLFDALGRLVLTTSEASNDELAPAAHTHYFRGPTLIAVKEKGRSRTALAQDKKLARESFDQGMRLKDLFQRSLKL